MSACYIQYFSIPVIYMVKCYIADRNFKPSLIYSPQKPCHPLGVLNPSVTPL